jgi:hypothetical protein
MEPNRVRLEQTFKVFRTAICYTTLVHYRDKVHIATYLLNALKPGTRGRRKEYSVCWFDVISRVDTGASTIANASVRPLGLSHMGNSAKGAVNGISTRLK